MRDSGDFANIATKDCAAGLITGKIDRPQLATAPRPAFCCPQRSFRDAVWSGSNGDVAWAAFHEGHRECEQAIAGIDAADTGAGWTTCTLPSISRAATPAKRITRPSANHTGRHHPKRP